MSGPEACHSKNCCSAAAQLREVGRAVDETSDGSRLATSLLNCHLRTLVELSPCAADVVTKLSDRPLACPLVRLQAATALEVTNRRHHIVHLNDAERRILCLLDGKHGDDELRVEVVNLCRSGQLTAQRQGELVTGPNELASVVANVLPNALGRFLQWALLIG